MNLISKKCIPCEGGVKPLDKSEAEKLLVQVSGWALILDPSRKPDQVQFGAKISKEYKFKDFIGAINFVNQIAEIAEGEGHHPDIHIHYNKVLLELSTHAIDGLSENDFIVAAKIDASK